MGKEQNNKKAPVKSRFGALSAMLAQGLDAPAAAPDFGGATPAPALEAVEGGLMSGLAGRPSSRDDVIAEGKYRKVALDLIDGDPMQPRQHFDQEELDDLAAQIKAVGMLQLPTVRPHPRKPGRFMLVLGERRTRAARQLQWSEIEVRFEELDDRQARAAQIIENSEQGRKGVTPWEEAVALADLEKQCGGQTHVVEATGLPKGHISKRLALLRLPDDLRELMRERILRDAETAYLMGNLWDQNRPAAVQLIERARKAGRLEREWVRLALRSNRSADTKAARSQSSDVLKAFDGRFNAWVSSLAGDSKVRTAVAPGKGTSVRVEMVFSSAEEAEAFLSKAG